MAARLHERGDTTEKEGDYLFRMHRTKPWQEQSADQAGSQKREQ